MLNVDLHFHPRLPERGCKYAYVYFHFRRCTKVWAAVSLRGFLTGARMPAPTSSDGRPVTPQVPRRAARVRARCGTRDDHRIARPSATHRQGHDLEPNRVVRITRLPTCRVIRSRTESRWARRAGQARPRWLSGTASGQGGAPARGDELGTATQTRLRHRDSELRALRRSGKDRRQHRRPASHQQNS
jgi:hypothetical protein